MKGNINQNPDIIKRNKFVLEDSPVSLLPHTPTQGTREIIPNSLRDPLFLFCFVFGDGSNSLRDLLQSHKSPPKEEILRSLGKTCTTPKWPRKGFYITQAHFLFVLSFLLLGSLCSLGLLFQGIFYYYYFFFLF